MTPRATGHPAPSPAHRGVAFLSPLLRARPPDSLLRLAFARLDLPSPLRFASTFFPERELWFSQFGPIPNFWERVVSQLSRAPARSGNLAAPLERHGPGRKTED